MIFLQEDSVQTRDSYSRSILIYYAYISVSQGSVAKHWSLIGSLMNHFN